jgi:hypothetical protein
MQQPLDVQGRTVLAAERLTRLRDDFQTPAREGRRARRRLGAMLIAAGARLAPAEARRTTTRARRV